MRATTTHDNWGGDETVTLTAVTTDLDVRVEWAEGVSSNWDIWCFDPTASFEEDDIILFEDADLTMAVSVLRAAPFTRLRTKRFHHWELITEEHELTVAELKTQAGL